MFEVIPQTQTSRPWWVKAILAVALVFLLAAVLGYVFFGMAVEGVERDIAEANRQIKDLATPENQALTREMKEYRVQFEKFSESLDQRHLASRVLTLLEDTAHPELIYRGLNINVAEASIQAQVGAKSYRAVGEQLLVFNHEDRIQRVATSGYSRNPEDPERLIWFSLNLDFDPAIIK